MSTTKFKLKSLHVKVSLAVAMAALFIMVVSSYYFYQRIYESSLAESERTVQQLLETVSTTAAIAAYVGNKELAQEVVRGLTRNDIVEGAEIVANGTLIGTQGKPLDKDSTSVSLKLTAPFDNNEIVGQLSVLTNLPLIAKRARDSALATTMSLAAQAVVIALLVLILVYWMMTRPLSLLSTRLHHIIPGDGKRLDVQRQHKSDEIGLLVKDINSLLTTVEKMLQEERQLRHRVELLEHRFRGIFEDSSAGIFLVRDNGTMVTANPAFFKLTGKFAGLEDVNADTNIVRETFVEPDQARGLIKLAIVSQRPCSCDLKITSVTDDEKNRWVHCIFSPAGEDQSNPVVEGVMYDITQRKLAEDITRELAEKDSLTGLANRQAAELVLKELASNNLHTGAGFVVMLIDLDRFKFINDTYGHDAGDWVLKVVAERLHRRVRSSDIVARLGGDEFLIILTQTDNHQKVKELAEKLLADQQQTIEVQPGFFETIAMSIGIAFYNRKEDNEMSIRKHADQAMYAVKRNGKNGYAVFSAIGKHEIFIDGKEKKSVKEH
jgi:diguanylate cyclase (GGDEF)-like protein/PAS domain S-box-containing protein